MLMWQMLDPFILDSHLHVQLALPPHQQPTTHIDCLVTQQQLVHELT